MQTKIIYCYTHISDNQENNSFQKINNNNNITLHIIKVMPKSSGTVQTYYYDASAKV